MKLLFLVLLVACQQNAPSRYTESQPLLSGTVTPDVNVIENSSGDGSNPIVVVGSTAGSGHVDTKEPVLPTYDLAVGVGYADPKNPTVTNAGSGTSNPTESIQTGIYFHVINPVPNRCYYRLTKSSGGTAIVKLDIPEPNYAFSRTVGCGNNAIGFPFCYSTLVRVELFSGAGVICDAGVTNPQNDKMYTLSEERELLGGIHLDHCGNNESCISKIRYKLTRRTKNRLEFTTTKNNGFQGFIYIGATKENDYNNAEYRNHYRDVILSP